MFTKVLGKTYQDCIFFNFEYISLEFVADYALFGHSDIEEAHKVLKSIASSNTKYGITNANYHRI